MAWPSSSARSKNWGTEILTDSDLESELDLLHGYINDMMNSSSGHKHDGTTAEGPKILTANINDSAGTAGDVYTNTSGTTVGRVAIGTAGQFLVVNSGATAPEWSSFSADDLPDGSMIQFVSTESGTQADLDTAIPNDNTIPQITEGSQVFSLAITPSATTNKILVEAVIFLGASSAGDLMAALFNTDAHSTNAQFVGYANIENATHAETITIRKVFTASDLNGTSETTFTVRAGNDTGDADFNGANGSTLFSTAVKSSLTITEIKAS